MNSNNSQNRNVIAIGILIILLPFMVIGALVVNDIRSRANPQAQPQQVVVSNVTSTSMTVSYFTEAAVTGTATASGAGGGNGFGRDFRDTSGTEGNYKAHYIVITNLAPETEYTIAINSGGSNFTDAAWKGKTVAVGSVSVPSPIYGRITSSGLKEGLVYAIAGDTSGNTGVASYLMQNETFVLDRNNFGGEADRTGKDMIIYVNTLTAGTAKAQFPVATNSVGNLELKQTALAFDPAEKITPGGQPDLGGGSVTPPTTPPTSAPVTPPVTPPASLPDADTISTGMLTEPYSSGAEIINPEAPYDIFISNLSPTGFTVNWSTKTATIGFLEILEAGNVSKVVDPRDGSITNAKSRFTHTASASSGSIPAGTKFQFQLSSNGRSYGINMLTASQAMQEKFSTYAASYKSGVSPTFSLDGTIPVATPFAVIIPAATDSPPLPVALQGGVTASIPATNYNALSSALIGRANNLPASAELSRDTIVAARTSTGLFVSAPVTVDGNFSLSLGSMLNEARTAYVSITNGTSLSVLATGSYGQSVTSSAVYNSDSPISLRLASQPSIFSPTNFSVQSAGLITGFSAAGQSPRVRVNGVEETSSSLSQDWQLPSNQAKVGLNKIELLDDTGEVIDTRLFIIDVKILPDTALDENSFKIIIGTILTGLGIFVYLKYWRGRDKLYNGG